MPKEYKTAEEMSGLLAEIVFIISKEYEEKITTTLKQEVAAVMLQLSRVFLKLNIVANYSDQKNLSQIQKDTNIILWQAANSIIAALQLIRQGYFAESHTVLRHAVEGMALSSELYLKPEKYEHFKSGKLEAQKCIGSGQKLVPIFGQMYSRLTEVAHPNSRLLGSYYYINDGEVVFLVGGHAKDSLMHRHKLSLAICGFATQVCSAVIEIIYFDSFKDHSFWSKQSMGYLWNPTEYEKDYGRIIEQNIRECLAEVTNPK